MHQVIIRSKLIVDGTPLDLLMPKTEALSRNRQSHPLPAQPAHTSPHRFRLPSASAFRRTVPNFLLSAHLEHITHAPRIEHMPEARHTKTPLPICRSFRIHDHFYLASTANSFDPFVRRGLVTVGNCNASDIRLSIFGCCAQ
jgi:hypothetical protein